MSQMSVFNSESMIAAAVAGTLSRFDRQALLMRFGGVDDRTNLEHDRILDLAASLDWKKPDSSE